MATGEEIEQLAMVIQRHHNDGCNWYEIAEVVFGYFYHHYLP